MPHPAETPKKEIEMQEYRVDDNLICGGQPTVDDLKRYQAAGVRTVVNMRETRENGALSDEKEQVESLGMDYVSFPVNGETDLTPKRASELTRVIRDSARPVFIHCGTSNRVGALLALSAHQDEGLSVEDAIAYGKKAGLAGAEPKVRALM